MALVNNFFELRSDAFKIITHCRRPIPARAETIGPWLEALTFLTWLGALTNSALVYLFCPTYEGRDHCGVTTIERVHQQLITAADPSNTHTSANPDYVNSGGGAAALELLQKAGLIALAASHGYMLVRIVVRHFVRRLVWDRSAEVRMREKEEREIKETFLSGLMGNGAVGQGKMSPVLGKLQARDREGEVAASKPEGADAVEVEGENVVDFWEHDEGLQEIQRISKEA
jgi:anoctamin-10